jgi:hypothetical protein
MVTNSSAPSLLFWMVQSANKPQAIRELHIRPDGPHPIPELLKKPANH